MNDLTKNSPYFDDYDESKQFTQILAQGGRVEQAREFTQLQTMIFDFLQRLSDTLFNNGAIVSGMEYKLDNDQLTIAKGKVYHSGKIHIFNEQTVTLPLTGEHSVGVKLEETIITENEDVTLLDPATGATNFGQAGAHRIKSVPILCVDDEEASELYVFVDGVLKIAVATPQLDTMTDILAKRTYDESGNYRVNGLDIFAEKEDANNMTCVVNVGTAYIRGYDVTLPVPRKKAGLKIAKATRQTYNEPKVYNENTNKYSLNNYPAKQVNRVMATVEVTETVTRGTTDIDSLKNSPVVKIQSIYDSVNGTYTQGTDYQLSGDGVNWNVGTMSAKQPSNGSTYTVNYQYTINLIAGTDYKLVQNAENEIGENYDYIEFLSGTKPDNGTTFYVDYDFFLARYDAICLDKDGNIIVVEGNPDIPRLVQMPQVSDDSLLQLGVLYFPPNSPDVEATSSAITRLTMGELQKMATRLDHVEYNLAVTSLDLEAMSGENPSEMMGIFSDAFFTTTKGDTGHSEHTVMYSLEDGLIMLPYQSVKENDVNILESSDATIWGRVVTAPCVEAVAINQPYATQSMAINPYLVFNTLGKLKCIPEVDNWVEKENITVEKTKMSAKNFNRWWRHNGENIQTSLINLKTTKGTNVSDWRGAIGDQITAVKTTTSSNTVAEAITYMRQRTVKIKAENLLPNSNNLELHFDGIRCALTPLAGYNSGSTAGTVMANAKGVVEAQFTIPSGVRTGTREVTLSNSNNTATTSYTAIGTKKTTTKTVLTNYITLTAVDPLAQTFQFEEDTVISAVGIFVTAKDTNNIVVQIRNVVNGYPSNTVYGQVVLSPDKVNASQKATAETKVRFDDPIYCQAGQQYAIVVETDSDTASLGVCDLGGKDLSTGVKVTRQPYNAGMLFSSSNSQAWTAHQSMNMKFKVYKCVFNDTGTVEFDPIKNMPSDTLLLLADSLTFGNTGCIWKVRFNTNGDWFALSTYYDYDLDEIIENVYLQATFFGDKNMSPMIAYDGFSIVGFLQETSGAYVSRNMTTAEGYSHVKIVYESYEPSGSSVTPYFAKDKDGKAWQAMSTNETIPLQEGWVQHTATFDMGSTTATDFRVKLGFKANSAVIRPKCRKVMVVLK